jgi:hypothetical protein
VRKKTIAFLSLVSLSLLVSLNSCNEEHPTAPAPEPEVIISPNAHVIDSTTSQRLLSVSSDGSAFTFSPQASGIFGLKANDVMVMQRDHGYLRKVTSVAEQTNGILVQTSDASLTDAVEKGAFSLSGALRPDNVQSVSKVVEGVSVKKSVLHPDALRIDIVDATLYERSGSQIKANGSLEIDPSFDFSIGVESSRPVQLAFTLAVQETANLSLTADIDFLQISEEKRIATLAFTPIIGTIGPIPVVVTPQLSVYVGIDGNASASFSSGATQQATFTAAVLYENGQWTNTHNLTNSFSFDPPTLTASLEAKAYVEARLELLFYGVLAPHASADGYLRITANPSVTPWWTLYGGLGVGAGVSVQILGRNIADYSVPDLLVYEIPLASATASSSYTEDFSADVFAGSEWSRSDNSVSINTKDGWLHIGSDGNYDDWADKTITVPVPFVIESRMRLVSEGEHYTLPWLRLEYGVGENEWIAIAYLPGDDFGWAFGPPSDYWQHTHTNAPATENQWWSVKARIDKGGGELFAKSDDQPSFSLVSTNSWTIPNQIIKIRFSQPWDALCDFDYVTVHSSGDISQ